MNYYIESLLESEHNFVQKLVEGHQLRCDYLLLFPLSLTCRSGRKIGHHDVLVFLVPDRGPEYGGSDVDGDKARQ